MGPLLQILSILHNSIWSLLVAGDNNLTQASLSQKKRGGFNASCNEEDNSEAQILSSRLTLFSLLLWPPFFYAGFILRKTPTGSLPTSNLMFISFLLTTQKEDRQTLYQILGKTLS